jgi:SulP family sulfate permease
MSYPALRHVRALTRGVRGYFAENALDPLPIRGPIRRYDTTRLRADLRAGVNVALLALPQGMAYAAIAELPIVYGIACSAVAAIVAPVFSGSRHTILGPTNATSLMIFSFFAASTLGGEKLVLMPMLCLLVGVFCIFGAIFKVAELLQFVSRSVLVGYISGASTLIIANQLKHLAGVAELMSDGSGGRTFFPILSNLIDHLPDARWQPIVLGLATAASYFFLQKRFRTVPNFALTLCIFSALAWALGRYVPASGFADLTTFDNFTLDALKPQLPDTSRIPFLDQIGMLAGVSLAVAFLASLENTVMSKSLASRTGDRNDINQDMLSVGAANVAAAFFAGMPASGSLTRSALNFESGARTRIASVFCGLICLGGLFLLAAVPLVSHIPKACLAALVIAIAISLISPHAIRICLRSTSGDAAVLILTFLSALVAPLHIAIFIGVAISIILFLRKAAHPHLVEYEISDEGALRELGEKRKRPNPAISIVHVEGDLFFGAAELFRTQIQRSVVDENLRIIILRLKNARHLDATSVMALEDLIKYTRGIGRHIIISGASRDVYKVLKQSGVLLTLQEGCIKEEGQTNLFLTHPSNPNISTRDALLRAQELLGNQKADIKIYYDPSKDKK